MQSKAREVRQRGLPVINFDLTWEPVLHLKRLCAL